LGCLALTMRRWSPVSLIPMTLIGIVGLAGRAPRAARAPALAWCAVTAAGVAAFALVRHWSPQIAIAPATTVWITANVVAAVAEEAFFRRFAYAHLERFGASVAIAVTAFTFAVVHIPLYGAKVFWIDLGAGLVLGWQRWSSGDWTSPAATHVVANILMMR